MPFDIVSGITPAVAGPTVVTDNHALFGKRVLITRPLAQDDDFASLLREAGAEPIVAPTIAIGPPDDPAPAREAVAQIRRYAWATFTSRNGVDAFFDLLATAGRDARALGDVKVAAIGPKTAEGLAGHGIRVDFIPEKFVNEDVAAGLLARTVPGERILIFRAQEARESLPDALRASGRIVDVVAAYATRAVVDARFAERLAESDVVTFTSASAVAGLIANVADVPAALAGKIVAAIGPITARAARERGIAVDLVADAFTIDGLIRALEAGVPT